MEMNGDEWMGDWLRSEIYGDMEVSKKIAKPLMAEQIASDSDEFQARSDSARTLGLCQ